MAFYAALLMIFFPPRLFVLRLVGAPETWFLSFILLSILFFKKKKYFTSALLAVLVQLLKARVFLLFAAYGLVALFEFIKTKKST